jgi:putative flavoprotein involved in K+ transport
MRTTGTLVIGAGQAGLSLSHHLTLARQPHVLLERGRVGERWHSGCWDSLTLLTPNWLNRLDGGRAHDDPDGFLSTAGFARYLGDYARGWHAPVREQVAVMAVERWRDGFRVATDGGVWHARSVAVATGDSAEPFVPALAGSAPEWLRQLHASGYRSPDLLPPGGVLVVGAGPSGQQIAAELRRAGREVVLAVGRHARALRRYRGRDFWYWLDALGDLERRLDECADPEAALKTPSVPLSGANGGEQLDLAVLQVLGVTIAGRVESFDGARVAFGPGLERAVAAADTRLRRIVDRIDAHVEQELRGWAWGPEPVSPVQVSAPPPTLDLHARGIRTVIWATGYRRDYSWLHVPVLDDAGEIVHREGVTAVPGLVALGVKFQRRRASHFIGRVGADAAFIAGRLGLRSRACRCDEVGTCDPWHASASSRRSGSSSTCTTARRRTRS